MDHHQSMPRWWRYWFFGTGLLVLLATGALYAAFDPSTALAYLDLLLLIVVALLSFLSGLQTQFRVGTRRIQAKHFVAASELLLGVLLLSFPAVAFLEQAVGSYDVPVGASGLLMVLFALGTLYRPAAFGPFAGAE